MRTKFKNQSGITLIALIITIIILVILAAVSIRAITNMGIVGHAINGSQEYANATVAENRMLEETGNLIEDTLAKLNNIQNGGSSAGGNTQTTEAPDLLKDYVLGAVDAETGLRPGRDLYEIFDFDDTLTFIDDEDTIEHASTEVVFLNIYVAEVNDIIVYAKYNNVAYRILVNVDYSTYAYTTSELVKVYEPEANSRVGTTVTYSVDGTQAGEREWLVLYDNGSTIDITPIDITAEDVEKENNPWIYTLGYSDPAAIEALPSGTDLERAQNSYENAVTRLNTYCGTLVTNPSVYTEGTGTNAVRYVRSIGTQFDIADTTARYSSTFLANNPTSSAETYNGVGLTGDMNGEQDVVRMSYYSTGGTGSGYTMLGYATTTNPYWLASRFVGEYSGDVNFIVRYVGGGIAGVNGDLWRVYASGAISGSSTFAVRPVVRVAV